MRSLFVIVFILACSFNSNASIVKKIQIEGQQYSCRPSNIETPCTINTDIAFGMKLAEASADSYTCLAGVGNESAKIRECFMQRKLRGLAQNLDIQMVGPSCWNAFLSKCTEAKPCPDDHRKMCGYLGVFLRTLAENGKGALFTGNDGLQLCRSLISK